MPHDCDVLDLVTAEEHAGVDAGELVAFGNGVTLNGEAVKEATGLLEFNARMTLRKHAKGGVDWRRLRMTERDGALFWVGFLFPEDVA